MTIECLSLREADNLAFWGLSLAAMDFDKIKFTNIEDQPNNPLHNVKLADMLEYLVEEVGWEEMGAQIPIRCFNFDPSVKSSLAFLRKTPWAREKVEQLYLKRRKG